MELPNIILKSSSANLESSKRADTEDNGSARQHLKQTAQYTREFKHDLHILILELEGAVNNDETGTRCTPEDYTPSNIEHDANAQRQNIRCCSGVEDEHADHSTGTIRPGCNPSQVLMELGQPRNLDGYVTHQQRRCASPRVFIRTGSFCSVSSSFISTHHHSRRCWPLRTHANEETENVVPSALLRRRPSMSSTSFRRVTGMTSCPSEPSETRADDMEEMILTGDEAIERPGFVA